jgi:hypothetical protein
MIHDWMTLFMIILDFAMIGMMVVNFVQGVNLHNKIQDTEQKLREVRSLLPDQPE